MLFRKQFLNGNLYTYVYSRSEAFKSYISVAEEKERVWERKLEPKKCEKGEKNDKYL